MPPHWPPNSLPATMSRVFSGPNARTMRPAAAVRPGYIMNADAAPKNSSFVTAWTVCGMPDPPASSGALTPIQPPEARVSHASLKPAGTRTLPSPSNDAPAASPGRLIGDRTPSAISRAWSITASSVSRS